MRRQHFRFAPIALLAAAALAGCASNSRGLFSFSREAGGNVVASDGYGMRMGAFNKAQSKARVEAQATPTAAEPQ